MVSMGGSTGLADTDAEFVIRYRCTGPVTGQTQGEIVLIADVTVAEATCRNALSAALAAALNPIVFPAQNYTTSDVRGLNL